MLSKPLCPVRPEQDTTGSTSVIHPRVLGSEPIQPPIFEQMGNAEAQREESASTNITASLLFAVWIIGK